MGKSQSKDDSNIKVVKGLNFTPRYQDQEQQPAAAVRGQAGDSVDPDRGQHLSTAAKMAAPTEEVVVCKVGDLRDGEMREFHIGERTGLLVNVKGKHHAVGNKCTHYGAPLSKGAYCAGRVRCPWHGACFDVITGDIEDFPGLDSLPVYPVEVRGDEVVVTADPEVLQSNKRVKVMTKQDPQDPRTFLIVGGGAAGLTCAETLRQEGFRGNITILSQEPCLPYDRPKLSKAMTSTAESLALRSEDFFKTHDIHVQTGVKVTSVDTDERKVVTSDGATLTYDALLLATGGRPRKLASVPGGDLQNVCVLRTAQDANHIAGLCRQGHVVIMGTSFIGLEVAAYARTQGQAASVSVVGRGKVPLEPVFGSRLGACIAKLHEDKGVKFYLETTIQQLTGEDGKLKQAILTDGTVLDADVCVLGIGVEPATEFLKASGVPLSPHGFVPVDQHMRTGKEGVYAAGDITLFPLPLHPSQPCNIQHWQLAHKQGRVAALNMMGQQTAISTVPYFWTVMYGTSIRYAGYGADHDDVIIHGDLTVPRFAAFFTRGDRVVGVASVAYDPIVSQVASLMERGATLLKADVMEDATGWTSRLKDM